MVRHAFQYLGVNRILHVFLACPVNLLAVFPYAERTRGKSTLDYISIITGYNLAANPAFFVGPVRYVVHAYRLTMIILCLTEKQQLRNAQQRGLSRSGYAGQLPQCAFVIKVKAYFSVTVTENVTPFYALYLHCIPSSLRAAFT